MAQHRRQKASLLNQPLFLLIVGVAAVAMFVPAAYALVLDDHPTSRSIFYAGLLGLIFTTTMGLALGGARAARFGAIGQLLSLFATFTVLPLYLALPFHDALGNTTFLNAYFDMVSSVTTTGANIYSDPERLVAPLHLWRAQVGWMGGLVMWIAASAILAPLSLGGFEVTARATVGRDETKNVDPRRRLWRITLTLLPVYAGLTGALWVILLGLGEAPLTAICHAMSVMATSGISPVGGLEGARVGTSAEVIMFLFLFFALSRLTFSADTAQRGFARLDRDPEFRTGLLLVIGLPLLLFFRHFISAIEVDRLDETRGAIEALWGGVFTVMSFLTTTGFESNSWAASRSWSGLETPGLLLMGLAVIGGGVATTAGGVKLLRVFALYLNGLREMERLVYPSSVQHVPEGMRIQRDGAFIAWIFFMLFALSIAVISVLLSALGASFEDALVLTVATLSTTGPLINVVGDAPIELATLSDAAKGVLCAAMILGRLETLAIVALLTPELWRR
jgi:trk system potassium uptake protein TrkH